MKRVKVFLPYMPELPKNKRPRKRRKKSNQLRLVSGLWKRLQNLTKE
jgi:hypothetical protein